MRRVIACFVLLLGLSSFRDAGAFWLTVNGGYNTYAMSDINDDIQSINDVTAPLQMDEISSGASYGWGFGIPVSEKVLFCAFGMASTTAAIAAGLPRE